MLLTNDLSKVTHDDCTIKERVKELADEIVKDLPKNGEPPVFIAIMGGAVHFFSDLTRAIGPRMHLVQDFMVVKSYEGHNTTGDIKILFDHRTNIRGRDVVIVEDIADTGFTLKAILKLLKTRRPRSIRVCVCFDKLRRRQVPDLQLDYIGFSIEDYFIVGYGLDDDNKYRHLSFTGMLKK